MEYYFHDHGDLDIDVLSENFKSEEEHVCDGENHQHNQEEHKKEKHKQNHKNKNKIRDD